MRPTLAVIAAYAVIAAAVLPFTRTAGPEMPGFNAAFATGVFVSEIATSFLLLVLYRQTLGRPVLVLANGYLFSALMAAAYLLTYPDALSPHGPLIGGSQSISWIYNLWIAGFALITLAAVLLEMRPVGVSAPATQRARRVAAATSLVTFAVAAGVLIAASRLGESLPMLSAAGSFSPLNATINFASIGILMISVALILLVLRGHNDLFLWLAIALSAVALGNTLSVAGGARYTVGWYACRLSWLASACVLLLYFMAQFVRQHGLLVRTAGDLEERTRERDRIWNVSEDLLGVSTFDGYFIAMNPAWTIVLGWSEEEIRRMHVDTLRHPDDTPHSRVGRARLAEGVTTVRVENRFRHKDGSWRWIAWTMTADQGLIYVAGRHITAEREAQELARKAEADAAHRQKMDSLGQLTGGVAHDFNNLLMVITGFLPRVKEAVAGNQRAAEAADAIGIASQRGAALTRQLVSFSRRQPVNPVVVELDQRIAGLKPLLAGTLGPMVELKIEIAPQLWPTRVDANEFELALINLILNARDALAEKPRITLAARNVRLAAGDTGDKLEGDFVAFSVADNGRGIAADILPRVFEPFFTTKAPNRGTGLGLSQVLGFAQQAGGTATIVSEPGQGTAVTLYLPRAYSRPKAEQPAEPQALAGGKALLVEDNADVAAVTREMLLQLGFTASIAAAADAALDCLQRESFDLMVSDIVMPGAMNGLELARRVRKRLPELPVLLVSGYSTSAIPVAGEFLVLRKPYRLEELRSAIARLREAVRSGPPARDFPTGSAGEPAATGSQSRSPQP